MKTITTIIFSIILTSIAFGQYNFNEIEIWAGNLGSSPRYFAELNGELYFQATENYKKEIWKTDGTQLGTSLAIDLNGPFSSNPHALQAYNSGLLFVAGESGFGVEPYYTDGTQSGTFRLADIRTGSSNGMQSSVSDSNGDRETFINLGGEMFFFANSGNGVELWKTNGTIAGTVSVKNFNTVSFGLGTYNLYGELNENMGVILNGELYFFVTRLGNSELWKTDGTTLGTVLIKDGFSGGEQLTVFNGEVYFRAADGVAGDELWSSDGTTAGTARKFDINPGVSSSTIAYMLVYNGNLVFAAIGVDGKELYKTDGTTLTLIKDIYPGTSGSFPNSSSPVRPFEYNGLLYFRAIDNPAGEYELWKSDGTTIGTQKAVTLSGSGGVQLGFRYPVIYDSKIFFKSNLQLWYTDGTDAGTVQVTNNGNPAQPIGQVRKQFLFQSNLWFTGENSTNGQELWYLGPAPPTSVYASECTSYTVPSGDETYVSTGVYYDTISNVSGGDSILQIDLTIQGASYSSINHSTCDTYISPSGNYSWNSTGVYYDTIAGINTCDSIITVNLTITGASYATINESTCDTYISPSGNYSWNSTGVYYDTIAGINTCDSIITVNLTLTGASYATINESTCDTYTSPSGNYSWNSTGVYYDTIAGINTCDSIITVNLTLTVVDTSVADLGGTLQSNSSASTYQWLDCNNGNVIIPGEIGETFTPTQTGIYAVQVTEPGGCSDTSACYSVTVIGIEELENQSVLVYPNPTTSKVNVLLKGNDQVVSVNVKDATGRNIAHFQGQGEHLMFDLAESAGIYFLEIKIDANLVQRIRVIKE